MGYHTFILLAGLVRKAGFETNGHPKNRLIFHLSHPRSDGTSINANTDEKYKHVKYRDLDFAVARLLYLGKNCYMSKTGIIVEFWSFGRMSGC